uniref:E3 ubiquitin-protein ligase AMFR isoform X2 n=1 Tax=Ciona intestinalis TaxID=7719 RepID=UPI000180BB3A|nr:E3 ubiquitin-protein ligase AMFR isoform X2 [Ciona intestinalis]|eukprot:XP_002127598.1 E3 ubiquitin-protein ligase AMFR isoform X2 [Ciona intestinalis]
MPAIIIFRRFPMPSISVYSTASFILLSLSILWAHTTILEERENFLHPKPIVAANPETRNGENSIENIKKPEVVLEAEVPGNEAVESDYKDVNVWTYPTQDPNASQPPTSSVTLSVKRKVHEDEQPYIGTEIAMAIENGEYSHAYGVFTLMLDEPVCLVLAVNATYCLLAIIVQIIQKLVFGKLRAIERQHMRDKFWNFVFYKFIFIFGVMNVQSLNEVIVWISWFTAIAFLLLLTKLCKDRFEFLSFSPNTPMYYHWKVLGLMGFIISCCLLLTVSCVTKSFMFQASSPSYSDIHSITFMLAECLIITVKSLHVIIRYCIHLYDIQHDELWERKATLVYHVDLSMELLSLSINFVHHLHMLFSGNIWLSMASLVICMQLRYIFSEIQKRLLRHKNYRRVVANMEAQFPEATKEEIEAQEDQCAICWEQMETARKLPCGHFFHSPCLRSWLEQDTTCPTCRKQLDIRNTNRRNVPVMLGPDVLNDTAPNPAAGARNQAPGVVQHRNHFWHFDGSRFATWLPSFSVEVMRSAHGAQAMVTTTTGLPANQQPSNSQLDTMVREVQDIFPQIPAQVIRNDLQLTGSVETTTDHILEGQVTIPTNPRLPTAPPVATPDDEHSTFQIQTPPSETAPGTFLRRRLVPSSTSPTTQPTTSTPSTSFQGFATQDAASTSASSAPPSSPTVVGGRFSKAPQEREQVLQTRRDELIRQARLKYLSNKKVDKPAGSTAANEFPLAKFNTNSTQVDTEEPTSASQILEDELQLTSGFGRSITPPSGTAMEGLQRVQGRVEDNITDDEMSEESLG